MSEMSDSSIENNEFQFYLLLVRQYIFQLPEEDERVRAAAWMVHLRRLRDAKDLKLRNDYIKLLLFAMHSRCLIGPFAQPPQKDKGLEHFPQSFTFPDMMRYLIEKSNAQSMRYCQSRQEEQSPSVSGEQGAQENLEEHVSVPKVSLTQRQICRDNFVDSVGAKQANESFVRKSAASYVLGVASHSNPFSLEVKVENLTKLHEENGKEYQSSVEDVKHEEGMRSAVDIHQEPQLRQDARVSLHRSHERISSESNLSTCEGNCKYNEKFCNNELHNNRTLRNSSPFSDTLKTNTQDDMNMAYHVDENNINMGKNFPFMHSGHSRYQHCHCHHYHKPVCHSNEQKTSPLEMGVTGRKCMAQMTPQKPLNGGTMTYAKEDFSLNYGHSHFSNDFTEIRRKHGNGTSWQNENVYNNFETNPLIANCQTDSDRHTINPCNHQARENYSCPHTVSSIAENPYSPPLEFNNLKHSAGYRASAETVERGISSSDEGVQKTNVKHSYVRNKSGIGDCVNITKISEQHKLESYGGSDHTIKIKHCSPGEIPKPLTEEQLLPVSELELPIHTTDKLSTNEVRIRKRLSAQDMHVRRPSEQFFQAQTETLQNMNSTRSCRYPSSIEEISTDMTPKAKSSEFSVAAFRASLSADLGAYSTGYAAGYSAGYAAGLAAALHSPS